ncbi:MAG: LysM peptidoglycan-binding domain-containing protein [Puniceicoccales bacterium]|nr:LysM peptidoglycan-binding domain-containing protein [Puniceicoccales bacterium]
MKLVKFFYKLLFCGIGLSCFALVGCSTIFHKDDGPTPGDTVVKIDDLQSDEAPMVALSPRPRHIPNRPVVVPELIDIDVDITKDVVVADRPKSGSDYVVKKGDTIWKLSRRFGLKVGDILSANSLDKNDKILVGQKIFLPNISEDAVKSVASSDKYTIQSGDTLSKIASKYGVTVAAIKSANDMTSDRIIAGRTIVIPSGNRNFSNPSSMAANTHSIPLGEYVVKPGDTLAAIAKRSGISVSNLQQANSLGDPSRLQVGKKLIIAKPSPNTAIDASITEGPGVSKVASVQNEHLSNSKAKSSNYDFMNDSDFFQGIDNIPIVQISE